MSRIDRTRFPALACVCLLLAAGSAEAGTAATPADRMRELVAVLAGPAMAGRGSGTPENAAAADTLAARLAALGLQPAFDGSWFQEFPLSGEGWTGENLAGRAGRNIAGVLPGSGALADRWVAIGAHYDHLGRLDPEGAGTGPAAEGEYYAGANDNASGVAVLLELVRAAVAGSDPQTDRRSLLVLSFGAEEVGLQGSGYLVRNPPVPLRDIDLLINLDTVGRLDTGKLYVSGLGTAAELPALVEEANTGGLVLSLAEGGWSGSDHLSFNTREVPVLFLFGGPYPEYNTPRDLPGSLDYPRMQGIATYAERLLAAARAHPGPFEWVMVGEKDLAERPTGGNRSTWFGSLPDFTEEIEGYPLAGVFDDSPAARAGLRKGDVLVAFAGRPVVDLATFTKALRAHGPGDLVEIQVLRDGRRLSFTVVLGDRSQKK